VDPGQRATLLTAAVIAGAALAAALFVALGTGRRRVLTWAPAVAMALAMTPAILDSPLDHIAPYRNSKAAGQKFPLWGDNNRNLTQSIYLGLRWAHDHSDPDDVLAVNNQSQSSGGMDARYFYYAAYSERRVLLSGWGYTGLNRGLGNPPPVQLRRVAQVNDAVYRRADPKAVCTMIEDYGVRFILIDRLHSMLTPATPALERLLPVRYRNADMVVLDADPARLGCRA
jgi:hypothetical protein